MSKKSRINVHNSGSLQYLCIGSFENNILKIKLWKNGKRNKIQEVVRKLKVIPPPAELLSKCALHKCSAQSTWFSQLEVFWTAGRLSLEACCCKQSVGATGEPEHTLLPGHPQAPHQGSLSVWHSLRGRGGNLVQWYGWVWLDSQMFSLL